MRGARLSAEREPADRHGDERGEEDRRSHDRDHQQTRRQGRAGIINVLSPDGKRIDNTYKNYNESGAVTSTTTAVYEKMP
jgi:hypothetical protein